MKKYFLIAVSMMMLGLSVHAQQHMPYNPNLDAMKQINQAVSQAKAEGKYVICQVGYNACPWCIRFSQYKDTNQVVSKIVKENFVYVHINHNKENLNQEAMVRLGNPGRFGYPVFVILDEDGKVIHIQNSAYLEEGKGYSEKLVAGFLNNWTRKAVKTIK